MDLVMKGLMGQCPLQNFWATTAAVQKTREASLLPVSVFIEHPEGFSQLLLAVGLFHLLRHHIEKLVEVDRAVAFTQ